MCYSVQGIFGHGGVYWCPLFIGRGGGGGQGHFKFYLNVILNKFKHSQFLQS